MAATDKDAFESVVVSTLAARFASDHMVRIGKGLKLALKCKEGSGYLQPVYVKWANGYYLVVAGNNDELTAFVKFVSPPYKARSLSKELFFHTTLSEASKVFASSSNGHLEVPAKPEWIAMAASDMVDKIASFYIAPLENFLLMRRAVIDDVLRFPEYYSYPFITALLAARKNDVSAADFPMTEFRARKLISRDDFDVTSMKAVLRE